VDISLLLPSLHDNLVAIVGEKAVKKAEAAGVIKSFKLDGRRTYYAKKALKGSTLLSSLMTMHFVAEKPKTRIRVRDGRTIGGVFSVGLDTSIGPWVLDEDEDGGVEIVWRVVPVVNLDVRIDSIRRSLSGAIHRLEAEEPLRLALTSEPPVLRVLVLTQGQGIADTAREVAKSNSPAYCVEAKVVTL
jgi:hypothetical protein